MIYPKNIKSKHMIMNSGDIIVAPKDLIFDEDAINKIFEYNDLIDDIKLLTIANNARKNAYCPYSNFSVGAALQTNTGDVFIGSNIETAAHAPDICAERVAFAKAIAGGYKKFKKIAILGNKVNEKGKYITPCGVCRQFMVDFVDNDFEIITLNGNNDIVKFTLNDLLPNKFIKYHI